MESSSPNRVLWYRAVLCGLPSLEKDGGKKKVTISNNPDSAKTWANTMLSSLTDEEAAAASVEILEVQEVPYCTVRRESLKTK